MKIKSMEQIVQDFLSRADVKINGKRPWDIQVNNQNLYLGVLVGGSIALGEAYMDGWWECKSLDQLVDRLLRARLDIKIRAIRYLAWNNIKAKIINQQRKSKAYVKLLSIFYIKTLPQTSRELFRNPFIKKAGNSCWIVKNRPRNFVFKGGLSQNRYTIKGQVKYSSYAQCMSVFYKYTKSLCVRISRLSGE